MTGRQAAALKKAAVFFLITRLAATVFSDEGESPAAEAEPADAPAVITAIEIHGLKRTKLSAAEKPLRRFIGREAAALDTDQVTAVIIDMEILEPLSVEIRDSRDGQGKILFVEVKEKWTIFPVPVFFMDSTGIVAGAAFYDSNAFGMNHRMAAAGLYQTGGMVFTALYIDPPDGKGTFGWNVNVLYTQEERRDTDQRDNVMRRFNSASVTAESSLRYQFTDTMSAALNLAWLSRMLGSTEQPVNAPSAGANVFKTGAEIMARKSGWDGYLLSEESASLAYAFSPGLDSPSFHSVSVRGVFEKSLLPGFRTNLRCGLLFKPEAPLLFESGSEDAQVNILPRSFSARHYAGISLGLEKHLFRFPFGTVSFLGAWQMVYSNGPLLGDQFDYGVLGSLFFYMSKIAIPALGFGLAYNIPAEYAQFSFMVGMKL